MIMHWQEELNAYQKRFTYSIIFLQRVDLRLIHENPYLLMQHFLHFYYHRHVSISRPKQIRGRQRYRFRGN